METVGALTPSEIFIESLRILRNKCDVLLGEISQDENDDRVKETETLKHEKMEVWDRKKIEKKLYKNIEKF